MVKEVEAEIAGRNLKVQTGKFATQADSAVMLHYGDTVILVTVTVSAKPREDVTFLPLVVDFEEKLYAVGKIPGGFIKREGKPGERSILTGRLIDRTIRPLFPKGFRNDVQVIVTCLSVSPGNTPELGILGIIGASAALCISDIPWGGPVGAVRVGRVGSEYIINPTSEQVDASNIDICCAFREDGITMIEGNLEEISEEDILKAIEIGEPIAYSIIELQRQLIEGMGRQKKEYPLYEVDEAIEKAVKEFAGAQIQEAIRLKNKSERDEVIQAIQESTLEHLADKFVERESDILACINGMISEGVRELILTNNIRPDGRELTGIRPISCEVGLLPRAHGSGLFSRGETQVLTVATLGAVGEEQIIDDLSPEESKRFLHQYNFPPYSTGEVKMLRAPSRREIGHGALAERALEPLIPSADSFPYTIRLVSEVLSSNGSTSMASVCSSSLALMDGGIPIKAPVAGVAMGLIMGDEKTLILTDIQGIEDFAGDMDFKVTSTRDGFTALQLDLKIKGISKEVLAAALRQGHEACLSILDCFAEVIKVPRKILSPYAPRIYTVELSPDKIGDLIGTGGKNIRKVEAMGVKVDIEEDGKVYVTSPDVETGEKAIKLIKELTQEVKPGDVYLGKVTRIMPFGAMVEVLPGKEGLVHISQLSSRRVNKVEDLIRVGDKILVKVMGIDEQGRVNLTRRGLLGPAAPSVGEK